MIVIDNFTKNELLTEIWKDIPGFEGEYLVSSLGRLKSLKFGEKIRKIAANKIGYRQVVLHKGKKSYTFALHRLVAELFIPNPDNKPEVMHLDNNKLNCKVSNLQWGTHAENISMIPKEVYAERTKKTKETMKRNGTYFFAKIPKPIKCVETGIEYACALEAQRQTGIYYNSIGLCCKGKRLTAGGYHWEYVE